MPFVNDSEVTDSATWRIRRTFLSLLAGMTIFIGYSIYQVNRSGVGLAPKAQPRAGPGAIGRKIARPNALPGPAWGPRDIGETVAWATVFVGAVALSLSLLVPWWIVGRSRRRIAEGFWTPPPSRSNVNLFVDPEAIRSDTGKLAFLYGMQLVVGALFNQFAVVIASLAYMAGGNPIALGVALVLLASSIVRFPARARVASWIESQQEHITHERQRRSEDQQERLLRPATADDVVGLKPSRAIAERTKQRLPADWELGINQATVSADPDWPTLPALDRFVLRGKTLAYRLPLVRGSLWGCLAVSLIWNTVTAAVIVAIFVRPAGWAWRPPTWFDALWLVPVVLIGLFAIYFAVFAVLDEFGVGPTVLEISDHPLVAGERYVLFLSQSGRLKLNSLRVLLVCEECAASAPNRNDGAGTRRVFEEEIFAQEHFEVRPDRPFEVRGELRVPAGAMHSFEANCPSGWVTSPRREGRIRRRESVSASVNRQAAR
jgi:hypothetical protein